MTGKLAMIKWYYDKPRVYIRPKILNHQTINTAFIFGKKRIIKWAAELHYYPERSTSIELYTEYRKLKSHSVLDFNDDIERTVEDIIDEKISKYQTIGIRFADDE